MRGTLVGGLAVVMALVASPALAAGLSEADVDRLIARAAQLQETGQWAEALAALEQGIGACGSGDDGRSCRVALRVRAGYIAERRSRQENDGAPLARRASAFYEEVLREVPGYGPALNNLALVYQDLGETPRGVAVLQRGLAADAGLTSVLAVTLGNLLREEKKADEALAAYGRALADDPDDVAAARRIVDLYRDLLPARIAELAKLLPEWSRRSTLDEAVEHGHLSIIETTYAQAESLALQSLVPWVELSARRRWISASSVGALPPAWKHAAVTDLAAYVAAPEQAPSRSWWRGAAPPRNALAGVALALGHGRLSRGDATGAAACWKAGVTIAPRYDEYQDRSDLKGAWMVRADLQSELASLYFKNPSLDPQRQQFTGLVGELFGGKAGAYKLGDHEAIQRYHTVLGLLFAQRMEWRSPSPFMNAVFQLSNAIKTADARRQERGPQPLPELKALLAQGYAETGRPQDAKVTYAQAAEAYLDTDDLSRAGEMLQRVRQTAGSALPVEPALDVIIRSRSAIPQTSKASLAAESSLRSSREHAWIFGGALPGLSAEFLARQRFKAMADFAARATEVGEPAAATGYAVAALNHGVKEVGSLIDFGDLVRLRNVRRAVIDRVHLDPAGGKASGKVWLLSVSGEAAPRRVELSPEVVLAGRVLETLRTDPKPLTKDVSITIRGSAVHIDGHDEVYLRDTASKLGRVEGISAVNVRTR